MYIYEFIDVDITNRFKKENTHYLNNVVNIIDEKSKLGYRLVQILPVPNEKMTVYGLLKYTIVFEKNIETK